MQAQMTFCRFKNNNNMQVVRSRAGSDGIQPVLSILTFLHVYLWQTASFKTLRTGIPRQKPSVDRGWGFQTLRNIRSSLLRAFGN